MACSGMIRYEYVLLMAGNHLSSLFALGGLLHARIETGFDAIPCEGNIAGTVPDIGRYLHDQEEDDEQLGADYDSREESPEEAYCEDDAGHSPVLISHILQLSLEADQKASPA